MPTLLFVCTANRFRSPLAAAYAARQLRDAGLPADWQAASAGTWTPAGLPAHPKALECEFPACRGRIALLGELAGRPDPGIPDPAQTDFTGSDAIAHAIAACLDQAFPAIRLRVEKSSPPRAAQA